ncbi:hypothetical protein I5Q34_00660 [Streptomyces sp. AV19]|uniref:hypothetical protein n=1 Tax=Streptomyces sp. AV19 TaxID=2793068 RepID=UPI0018FE1E55|nr:hypothetical protein [Streptomyces sp. AV19]MBH1932819.1 hypothetical protein [Streptomyces sp. AV19]MDG4531484.1 hypothetical protein [Streptomyces sp. AV19]
MRSSRPWWQRRTVIIVSALTVLVVLSGAGLYFSGAYDNWQDERSLSTACDGMLDHSEVKSLLEVERPRTLLSSSSYCSVVDPGKGKNYLGVDILRGERVHDLLISEDEAIYRPPATTPVGSGWAAFIAVSGRITYANAYLSCGSGADGDIVVSAKVHQARTSAPLSSDRRAKLARTATATLSNAAEKWGCTGKPHGGNIDRVPSDSTKVLKRVGEAVGTCKGIEAASYESAVNDTAPVEVCVLADGAGKEKFRIGAYYGPYEKSARAKYRSSRARKGVEVRGRWAAATCPSGEALYVIERGYVGGREAKPDPALEEQALKKFAANSAKRHGCSPPTGA